MQIKNIWDNEPDFVNEMGVKWWYDESLTDWARREDKNGISLPTITAWVCNIPKEVNRGNTDYLTHILIDESTQVPVYESQKLEECTARIDVLKMNEQFDLENTNE